MDQDEFNALVGSARQEYEEISGRLTTRIEALRKSLERDERRLAALRELYDKRLHDITRAYAGLAPLPTLAPPSTVDGCGARGEGKRNKRGALDGPLLELVREVANPVVTVPQMTDAWNQRHGSEGVVSRSTVRGALERHVAKGALDVAEEGGRGSNNPRTYAPLPSGK
jgi:hypothetical protein